MNKVELLLCTLLVTMLVLTFNQKSRLVRLEKVVENLTQSEYATRQEYKALLSYLENNGVFGNGD